jgi:hypothetical protein
MTPQGATPDPVLDSMQMALQCHSVDWPPAANVLLKRRVEICFG